MLKSRFFRRPPEQYEGLFVGCAPGTHNAVVDLITRITPARHRGSLLDIGAHSGALLRRFRAAGFQDLSAADLDTTAFKFPGVPLTRIDANTPFAHLFNRKFDVITCTDIIEHLDSPRQFFTEARKLLTDDGLLAFSVPNVAFWEGRVKFALTGELWGFGRGNYVVQRHISPLTIQQTELLLRELGLSPVAWTTAGSFATAARNVVLSPLWLPFYLIDRKRSFGESLIFLARRSTPELDLRHPFDYQDRWDASADVQAPAAPAEPPVTVPA